MAAMTGPGAGNADSKPAAAAARLGSSHLSASTDLDAAPDQLPVASVLDDSLQRRKAAAVSSIDKDGAMRDFTLVLSEGAGGGCKWAVGETQGRRGSMEDAHVVCLDADGDGSGRTALFAVFDGHSGGEVSAYCAQHIVEVLKAAPSYATGDLPAALKEAFLELDRRMQDPGSRPELAGYRQLAKADKKTRQDLADKEPAAAAAAKDVKDVAQGDQQQQQQQHGARIVERQERELEVPAPRAEVPPPSRHAVKRYGMVDKDGRYVGPGAGSTAAVAVLRGDQLAVAHAGDSRVVLCENGVAQALTQDHKPDTPAERDRIYQAGLFVMQRPGGVPRVGGSLAMSRAMGDVKFKAPELPPDRQAVTAAPDTTQVRLGGSQAAAPGDPAAASHPRLLVVACDGLWDVMERQQVCNFLELQLGTHGGDLRGAVRALVHEALRHDSAASAPTTDNVTVLVAQLTP
ncbi:hypothetical protein HYH02_006837 [Chlamydomonas schloesseri]|uniref:PPM-type phosphatase domain-containing protein n=1 Tax=Chlamydomonas schloesseri TaxID=2026947 RepID=A0A836B5T5_9CHLO|nr:hypothetical protein HYH02_006837 [Chlamydomonas schloesseri]|eukprot:KAG2448253.1 hypothetical protein HYH02_006837 [Chlamydomonas schloesseri]